jgi:hypothetical protein
MFSRTIKKTSSILIVSFMLIAFGGVLTATADTTPAGYPINAALYLTMRDGVDIAIDVWLPADLEASEIIPTVIRSTRYWRAVADVDFAEDPRNSDDLRFHEAGYAVVMVDARGSGASTGERPIEFSADEVADMGEVVDWIVAQPWSNGRVGGYGVSYEGNTAELLTVPNHPAVRAVAPLYDEFDSQFHLLMPGGVFDFYIEQWGAIVQGFDANDSCPFLEIGGLPKEDCAEIRHLAQTLDANEFCAGLEIPQEDCASTRALFLGVKPVDADPDGERLAEIIANRTSNVDVFEVVRKVTYRDDPIGTTGETFGQISPYGLRQQIESSGVPMYVWVGWLDAATADGAISRYLTFSNPQQLIIGPFSHGGEDHTDPFLPADTPIEPTLDEQFEMLLQFFDRLLKDDAIPETGITYYTLNAGVWNTAESWPPAGFTNQRWYFVANGLLTTDAPTDDGTDEYTVDFSATTGDANRWYGNFGLDVIYPDRAAEDEKLLTYTSVPLTTDVEITGHPIVTLHVASTHEDGAFHVYLEDVAPDGRVTYITEGVLRAIHHQLSDEAPIYNLPGPYRTYNRADASPLVPGEVTEVSFNLYATSVLIETGHRIRIAIAGADASIFERYPAEGTPVLTIHRNAMAASHVDLPMMKAVEEQPDVTNVFFTNLSAGLNLISLPLEPITPYTARSFAEEIGATMVIRLDEARQRFVGFTLDAPDDGFAIEGGKGYIVNVTESKVVAFTGAAWTNQPPVESSPSLAQTDGAWAFVVSGRLLDDSTDSLKKDGYLVTLRNTRTNAVATDVVRSVPLGGEVGVFQRKRATYFAAAFADLNRKDVIQTGDRLEVVVRNTAGEMVSDTLSYTVTKEAIRHAYLALTLKNIDIPRQSLLLQNYPNPFNPETWIPYQIRQPAEVVIRIYNTTGQLVRTLDLGQRQAGFYLSRSRAAYWNGKNDSSEPVSSGLYFYQLQAGNFNATRKLVIVK